ncbi:MAG: peptidase domain-containing ABC transporter [Magnetococcales bacterium]|nr:peptidase domain-containing ABC transporter [Magnetococcales bacterium]
MQSGLKCLALVGRHHGLEIGVERLRHDYRVGESDEPDQTLMTRMASEHGLKARLVTFTWPKIQTLGKAFPVVAPLNNGHYVILTGFKSAPADGQGEPTVMVLNPMHPDQGVQQVGQHAFSKLWSGALLLLKRAYELTDLEQPFSSSWVLGAYLRQKGLMAMLVLIAFVLNLFAVVPAVFMILVLDKVVNYQATDTLYVISIGVIIAYIFNAILGYLRDYTILFTTSRLEARLNVDAFNRMMNLPLEFFQKRGLSGVIKTMQQTSTLRQVISGRFIGAALDSTALLIFVPILYFYSPLLSLIVIGFSALISLNVILTARMQKSRLRQAIEADNRKQSIMMNSVSGIETIKSLAIEPEQKRSWEEAVFQHISANFQLGKINALSSQIGSALQSLMTVAVIVVGVNLVFAGELSAGVIIGISMLAGRVTGPLVQLVTLETDLEKTNTAIQSLGSILNTKGETGQGRLTVEFLGGVQFRNVTLAYPDGTIALDNLSFTLKPRQHVAIVGRQGAGKTSIARLLQKMLQVQSGSVNIDAQDVRTMDPNKLRYNVAMVNESTILFDETIRENIIKPFPEADMARVEWAAKTVGLHDDVLAMPLCYETVLVDGGANLPEVQRKKIALARALIRNPKILILDEIFSRLDVDGGLALKARLEKIGSGRTLILLSAHVAPILNTPLIMVMEKGRITEWGNHGQLMQRGRLYADLYHKESMLWGGMPATQPAQKQRNRTQQPAQPPQQATAQPPSAPSRKRAAQLQTAEGNTQEKKTQEKVTQQNRLQQALKHLQTKQTPSQASPPPPPGRQELQHGDA